MTGPNQINRFVIRAANQATPTTKPASGIANWTSRQADKVVESPLTQKAAVGAESLATKVINSIPFVKDAFSGVFEKVDSLLEKTPFKTPLVKAYHLGMETFKQLQQGKNLDEVTENFKTGARIIQDDLHSPKSTKEHPEVLDLEKQVQTVGVNLNAANNYEFGLAARSAVIRLNTQKVPVPKDVKLSALFEQGDVGYTNTETHPASTQAIFFNAKADWTKLKRMTEYGKKNHIYSTEDPLHVIYHEVGRTLYNGKVGNKPLTESMTERERLKAQEVLSFEIKTPQDFMGEMLAHLMVGRDIDKKNMPLYDIYKDWGGVIPDKVDLANAKTSATPQLKPAEALDDIEIKI